MTTPGRPERRLTRRLRVEHRTTYAYDPPAPASFNEARMSPRTEPRQQILESQIRLDPVMWRHDYVDYWRTAVTAFEVHRPHSRLEVVSTTVADIIAAGDSPRTDWARLRTDRTRDAFAETLVATERSEVPDDLVDAVRTAVGDAEPHDAARRACAVITAAMEYAPGSTEVASLAGDSWAARRGVCQDFAHLALGALRALDIPARYVSGYIHPRTDAEVNEAVTGESHAWVEWWTGGWFGWDPTNDSPAGNRHLAVGRGRDYGDVPPLKGIVAGANRSSLDVDVTVTLLR